jgi:hypothetical protein
MPLLTLPGVTFCGLTLSRLVIGANPFGGYSHQNRERDTAMRSYYTVERIMETWEYAAEAGITAMVANNETPHVLEAVREYLGGGGKLQWIAQINFREKTDMEAALDEVVEIGCAAVYIHGLMGDRLFEERDEETLRKWCALARSRGVPAGVAGHVPDAHRWVDSLGCADFHAVSLFNCGSVHEGEGERFSLADRDAALSCIRDIEKPCIAYKIMGAGRIDPREAFAYAFAAIKPSDIVNVGMHRGDNDSMVQDNAALVRAVLGGRVHYKD